MGKIISYDKFIEKFKPITNHIDDNASLDGTMFETYGAEMEFVNTIPVTRVWTLCDDGEQCLVSGKYLVNRIGYIVTEKEYTSDTEVYFN
jgi:hypothetical protein